LILKYEERDKEKMCVELFVNMNAFISFIYF